MKNKLNILMVFPEIAPFIKTGEVGEVGGSLPKFLKEMGHDVRVITPQYKATNERKYILRDVIRLQNIHVPLGKKSVQINVKSAFLPNSKVQVYFIDYKPFFFREGLYGDPKSGKAYIDNDKRYILFSKGVLATLSKLQWQPDIIHCHDWQSGLIPFLLKTKNKNNPFFQKTYSLFTVHNFANQGLFDPICLSDVGVNGDFIFKGSGLEQGGKCSFLKAGIKYADGINTVSATYAQEIQKGTNNYKGIQEALQLRKDKFSGIVNGVDDSYWNPDLDELIPEKYNLQTLEKKEINKQALIERFKLSFSPDVPVISMISPLTEDKGLDLLQDSFERIIQLGVVFLLMGEGKKSYYQFFSKIQKKYSDRVGVFLNFDQSLFHLMIAGSDMIIMPSKTEPCGLIHLYGMRYGTIPIVRNAGGLADTVQSFSPTSEKGNGFVFDNYKVTSFLKAVKQAVQCYQDKKSWVRLMRNCMRLDISWRGPAKKYIQLYNKCISSRE
jgi:starch synthase